MSRPVVIIPACTKVIGGLPFDAVGRKYTAAIAEVAECQPLLAPVGTGLSDLGELLRIADGILLPGSPSNVAPEHYSSEAAELPDKLDPARDAVTLPLVRAAIETKKPLLAICRGFQELNVALGGTLHQAVHKTGQHMDHRESDDDELDLRYAPVHPVILRGELRDIIGAEEIMVNSLHGQGINKLSNKLEPQAHAKDGLIEAVRGPREHPFCFGVQWHPEWMAAKNPVSIALFRRFGAAAGAIAL
jgi:putative glutamine amidotransferase